MKKNVVLSILIFFFVFTLPSSAQKTPEELVKKDYPKLYNDFKAEVGGQKARYIFAVDVSDSMKPYGNAVKSNIKNFISALPEGDFVTLVQKCGTDQTDIIFNNQPVNSSTKSTIFNYIDAIKFDKVGSDGYRMTDKIIEALNQTGASDDMKYVFMFTDFEYYTEKNHYNKNAENWKALKNKFEKTQKGSNVIVSGARLALSDGVNGNAVYENELKDIFGKVDITPGASPAFLNTWFNNIKANILKDRLQYVLSRKTEKENEKLILKASGLGKDLSTGLKEEGMSSVFSSAELDASSLAEVQKISEKRPWIGSFSPKPVTLVAKAKLRAPNYRNEQKSTPTVEYNEADKLLEPQFAEYRVEVYEGKPYLPWYIGWPLVGLLGFWMLSILYRLLIKKVTRTWSVRGTIKENNGIITPLRGTTPINPTSFCIGRIDTKGNFDLNIDGVGFCFKIESRKNISCLPLPGLKSGYYIANIGTGNAELIDAFKKKTALGNNNFKFLSKPGAFTPVTLKIKEGNKEFEIKVQ